MAIVTHCEPPRYAFNFIAIVAGEESTSYRVVYRDNDAASIRTVGATFFWLKVEILLSAFFAAITLVISPLVAVWHQRRLLNCLPVCCMTLTGLCCLCGTITATTIYISLKNSINGGGQSNIEGHMGFQMFACLWLWLWTSWSAVGQWFCAAICCPGGHRKRRFEMRQRTSSLL